MTWTRLSDDFADSPEVLALSDAAFRAHVNALIWANKHLTDGAIPTRAVRLFTASDPEQIAAELVAAELWHPDDVGFRLDWSDQESAQAVEQRTKANKLRQRKWRETKAERDARHAVDDHTMCTRCSAVSHAVTDKVTNSAPYPTRPVPDPTNKGGKGTGQGEKGADASAPSATAAGASPSGPLERMRAIRAAGKPA